MHSYVPRAFQVFRNQVRAEFHIAGGCAVLVETCKEYLHPRDSQRL